MASGTPQWGSNRTYIPDARDNGRYLRCSWHGDRRAFVVSCWDGSVCTSAIQLGVADAARLADALVRGLAAAAVATAETDAASTAAPAGLTVRSLRRSALTRLRRRAATAASVTAGRLGLGLPPNPTDTADDSIEADGALAEVRWLDEGHAGRSAPR